MKHAFIILCMLVLAASKFVEDSDVASWSKVVNGVQAQITIKEAKVVNETRIISTYLTLRNVSDVWNPIKVEWDSAKITYCVVDDTGVELPKPSSISYDGFLINIGTLVLPYDSTLTFNISRVGLGIPKGRAALLDFGPENSWIIDKADGKRYFLLVTLMIEKSKKPRNERYWHGTIDIPKAEIPCEK